MDFSDIKLIVTDMDGTLLNEKNEVSTRFFQQFEELKKHDIHFVAASGRQYQSILSKLEPIKDEISIIGENGGIMQHADETKVLLKLTEDDVQHCITLLRSIKDCFIVLCGRKSAYIESSSTKFMTQLSSFYSEVEKVDDLTEVTDDDFVKIAVYHFESSEAYIYPQVQNLMDSYQVVVSGQNWLDISHKEANKAYALKIIQQDLGVTLNETMVFGDYNNDIGMLQLARLSFAMKNAHPNVIKIANYQTKSNTEEGVEDIIEKLLISKLPNS
ncbi:HAD family hydrolase [Psychroflexus sp. MES1-P1E]|uniref:HAD family hydrolase n=1 Tax=Psychroflexus sp. MES1-P1E TaxID=2058320 RepID=UPI000C799E8F|nr:HAD family hydrolase [Psychroflexus sp. MES1-P1E]PKG44059.1 Cof-type HAD-IIB family hydrolase [Psychroflexus sp. MES1-P1E]